MSETTTIDEFVTLLHESNLLPAETVDAALEQLDDVDRETSASMAKALIRRGLLTRFQAERLLAGRARGFFIADYKVLELLGFGGMGSLYLAEHLTDGTRVALKVLNERHRHDAGMLARLKLEAAAGGKLHHDKIVRTHAVDDTGAICYVVMEFVKGISLFEYLGLHGPLPSKQVCDIALQGAEALAYSHENGIVHRDVKPENLIIDARGNVKLLDFGLALVTGESETEFSLAMIFGHDCVGTPDYISPEQAIDCQAVDGRADIYSLGCTMYYLLTGQLPFPDPSGRKKIEGHLKHLPRPIAEVAPWVDPAVIRIVQRMMSRRRDERYQTMDEVIAALRPHAERRPAEFRFNEILSQRTRDARTRSALENPSRVRPKLSSRVATASSVADGRLAEQAAIETLINSDTKPSSSGTYRNWQPPAFEASTSGAAEDSLAAATSPALLISLEDGRRIPLDQSPTLIGRHAGCPVRIDSGGVSGKHAELRQAGTWWQIADLDSKNGVEVNGVKVREQLLWHGDLITIAHQHRFQIVDPTRPLKKPRRTRLWILAGAAVVVTAALAFWFLR